MGIGMVGLGRKGLDMARRLVRGGVTVTACNRTAAKAKGWGPMEAARTRPAHGPAS